LRIKSQGTAVGQVGRCRQIGEPESIALIGQQTMVAGMTPSQLGVDRCGRQPITSRLMLLRLLKSLVAAGIEVSAVQVVSPMGSSISNARMTTPQGPTGTR
jgi:hypothetical protein